MKRSCCFGNWMHLHCIGSLHKVYRCSHSEKKSFRFTLQHSSVLSNSQGAVVPKTDGIKTDPSSNLLELSVLQSSYFSRCQEGASPDDVTVAAGSWAVSPPPAHTSRSFTLNAMLSPQIPGQFRSGFCHREIRLKYQVLRAYQNLRLQVKVEDSYSSTS